MTERAPESPAKLERWQWMGVLKRTAKQFGEDKLNHWAAALTYYAVLSIFPALLAMISLLGLFGQSATQGLIDNLNDLAPGPAREILINAVENLQGNAGASGLAFVVGLAGAIWAASGYVGGFMEASNAVWDAPEGRPIWKKLPLRVGLTVLMLVLLCAGAVAVVATGPIAQQLGNIIGVGDTFLTVWSIAKWPVLVVMVSLMISLLFYLAPNVKQPGFPWVSPGGLVAVLLWIVASVAFAFYVANFSSYNETYGSLGGVIVFLIWLWVTNNVILLGAEFNAELERSRALSSGMPPEKEPYLPLRDEPKDKTDAGDLARQEAERLERERRDEEARERTARFTSGDQAAVTEDGSKKATPSG